MKNVKKYFLVVILVIAVDQFTKLWVHFNMPMGFAGQIRLIGDWLKLYYTLNPGMAFGIKFGFVYGKLFLTVGRIIASCAIGRYIYISSQKPDACSLTLIAWSFVLGGAIGNVIDSTFYGVLLHNAPIDSITPWMHGQVIDMILVDLWSFRMPTWVPFFSGQYIRGFPIFNLADTFISLGVFLILIKNHLNLKEKYASK